MKIRITNGMFVAILVNMVYAKAIGVTQGMVAREIGQDMWIATALATLQGIGMIYFSYIVLKKTPQMDFVELANAALGRWFGLLVSVMLIVFFFGAFGTVLLTFVYHLRDYFLPEMPLFVFVLAALGIGWYAAYHGLEVMGRMAFAGVFFILLLNALIMIGSYPDIDMDNLRPVMESGLPSILWASRHSDTDWAMATMVAGMIQPMVKNPEVRGRSGMVGIALGGIMVGMWPILEAGVLSAEVTQEYFVSCMKLARNAHIGHFVQRYEMIMIACFSVSSILQITMCLFAASIAASKAAGLKDYRPMLIPVGLALGGFGYWAVHDHMLALELMELWPYLALPIAVGLPAMLLAARLLAKKRVRKAAEAAPPS
ncbi:spore gernimation protein [Paenibacillus antri]|uniref:Spore gernimation protein n=1 Tax=Paenibacillus antri TaxID=2582848 RepID=A0A5R9G3L8_9BACL|nr:GerAB/ArcD/ProY family transporter [Paenibacillus antri]TLS50967.1 spore gernimation protein [Paenibacillus antri]